MNQSRSDRSRRASGPATLREVAERAGVSLATASRVLNGSTRVVNPELAARVDRAAAELRYVSNAPAQALARATTSVVGLIVHEVDDPYFAAIAAGAMRVATGSGLLTMLASTFRDADREVDYVRRFQAQRVRALLLTGSGRADDGGRLGDALAEFVERGGRVAVISDHALPYDAVLPANERGGAQVARLLHDLGHRDVGVISGPAELTTVRLRLAGFCDEWRRLGGELPDEALCTADFSRAGGRSACVELMERRPGTTAIFALNDLMAVGALAALPDLGLLVPRDLSVVGFDDLWFSADVQPSLTTVRLPLEEMGARAMSLVLDAPSNRPHRVHFPAELVVRGTTGPRRSTG
ncbi:LacI family DNA-binding transcriptional regulator [Plantactinospora siamensis]|uniref:LacI family DNA-binding transcriptional regulator n=1 Tax=Plantactinospora siamensis TaxID=555372 RepID=A0ABV6P2H9_9ACTN